MTQMVPQAERRQIIHVVDRCSKRRNELARAAIAIGHHAEIYNDVNELAAYSPYAGIIILHDAPDEGGPALTIERIVRSGIWLPIILAGEDPSPSHIVEGIKAGALDYLKLPIAFDRLERCLGRIASEAERNMAARREMIDARNRLAALTARENQVLQWLSEGNSNKSIARHLNISPRTVEIHRSNMMSKLGARHAIEAVRLAMQAKQPVSI